MSRALATACAAALLAAGCGKTPEPPANAAASAAPAANAVAVPVAAAPAEPSAMRLRGAGEMGKDGYGITLCGEDQQRIATLEPAAQAVLDAFVSAGHREFRMDAVGDLVGKDKLHVRSFERLAVEGLGCDERESRFTMKAHGTEPFWHLVVDGGQGSFSRPDHEEASGALRDVSTGDGVRRYEIETLAGRLQATITPGPCNDGMADTIYGWKAEVVTAGETLAGCAYRGPGAR